MNCLRLLSIFLLAALSAHAASLSGTVLDSTGALIPNAHIVVHWDSIGLDKVAENVGIKADMIITANDEGYFSMELPPGVYDIFVTAAGFYPYCEKLSLKKKETRVIETRLAVSRMLHTYVD